jgi:hypothetical protein
MFTRTGLSALLSLTLGVIIAPTTVSAEFGPRFPVSGPVALGQACRPQVAIDRDGDAVFSWERFTSDGQRVEARTRSAAGEFGPIHIVSGISKSFLPDHRLAIDAGGNAVITWNLRPETGPIHAQFRALSAAGVLGPIENLTNVLPADSARVAMNRRGTAIFAWRRLNGSQGVIETRMRSAAGVLGPIQRLPLAGTDTRQPEVAINAAGEAVFTWVRSFGSQLLVQARRRSAVGQLAVIHQNLDAGSAPQAAIDDAGNAIISWTHDPPGTIQRVRMRTLSPTNLLSNRQPISQGSGGAVQVQIAMNATGDALFTFIQSDQAGTTRAKARSRSSAGVFGPDQALSPAGQSLDVNTFGAAIDARRRSLFAWTRSDPPDTRVEARTRSATGVLRGIRTLSPAPIVVFARVAMNARGEAVIAWCQADEVGSARVFGATFAP